jgi:hypothetical protein
MLVSEPRTGRGSTGVGGGTPPRMKMIPVEALDLQSRRLRRRCFDGLVRVRLFSRFVVFQGFAARIIFLPLAASAFAGERIRSASSAAIAAGFARPLRGTGRIEKALAPPSDLRRSG